MNYLCKQTCLFREIKLIGKIVLIPIHIWVWMVYIDHCVMMRSMIFRYWGKLNFLRKTIRTNLGCNYSTLNGNTITKLIYIISNDFAYCYLTSNSLAVIWEFIINCRSPLCLYKRRMFLYLFKFGRSRSIESASRCYPWHHVLYESQKNAR